MGREMGRERGRERGMKRGTGGWREREGERDLLHHFTY